MEMILVDTGLLFLPQTTCYSREDEESGREEEEQDKYK